MSEEKKAPTKLDLQSLQNLRGMLNRVPLTGPEAFEWVKLRSALDAMIAEMS